MCDYKKILIAGLLNYAVIFLATTVFMFVLGVSGMVFAVMTWVTIALTVYLLSQNYYFTKKPKKPLNEGLMLGLGIGAISFVIEIFVMVNGFASDMGWSWFMQWEVWVSYLVMVITPVCVAMSKKK